MPRTTRSSPGSVAGHRRQIDPVDVVEEFDSPSYHAALRQTVRKWRPAIAQFEFTQLAQYAGDCEGARAILTEHDITLDLYQQLLEQGEKTIVLEYFSECRTFWKMGEANLNAWTATVQSGGVPNFGAILLY